MEYHIGVVLGEKKEETVKKKRLQKLNWSHNETRGVAGVVYLGGPNIYHLFLHGPHSRYVHEKKNTVYILVLIKKVF